MISFVWNLLFHLGNNLFNFGSIWSTQVQWSKRLMWNICTSRKKQQLLIMKNWCKQSLLSTGLGIKNEVGPIIRLDGSYLDRILWVWLTCLDLLWLHLRFNKSVSTTDIAIARDKHLKRSLIAYLSLSIFLFVLSQASTCKLDGLWYILQSQFLLVPCVRLIRSAYFILIVLS